MNKFKPGDVVVRRIGKHGDMLIGDTDVVTQFRPPGMNLKKFGIGHNPDNFELAYVVVGAIEPIGDPDDSPVEHPKHYNSHPSGVECITIARHHNFNIGNVFKYLWRIGLKGAKAASKAQRLQEIDKAIFYLQDERARIEAEE